MILTDFLRALGQTFDRRFRRVLLKGVGLTIALLAAVTAAVLWGLNAALPDTITLPLLGEIGWLNEVLSGASLFGMAILSIILMVPVASAFVGMFLDEIVDAVEVRHYPHLPDAGDPGILGGLADAARGIVVLVVANILALAVYVLVPPLAPVIFVVMNGYLLGREYFQMIALRRQTAADAKRLRRRNIVTIWIAGILMVIPLTIPVLNLVIPILGVASFTHLYHRAADRAARRAAG